MNKLGTYKIAGTLILLSLWVGTGCKKTPVTNESAEVAVSFSLKTDKKQATSRAKGDDEFLPYSMIGIFGGQVPVSSVANIQYRNVGYASPSGSSLWDVAEGFKKVYFPYTDAGMNFYVYHPHSAQRPTNTSFTAGGTSIGYTLPTSQSTVAELKTADLLWGMAENQKKSQGGTVELVFHHKLAKLSLAITKGSDWGNTPVRLSSIKVSGANVLAGATMDILTGALTPQTGSSASVTCNFTGGQLLSLNNSVQCDFILVPAPTDDIKLTFVYDSPAGSESEAVLSSGLSLKSGTQLNVGVKVNNLTPNELSIAPAVVDWRFSSQVEIDGL